jgi:hypothetical protein
MLDLIAGIRRQGPVTNLPAAGAANAVAIFRVSNFAGQLGAKTFKIKRLKIRNNNAGNGFVHFGTGIPLAAEVIPALYSIGNTTDDYVEGDLPQAELAADLTAYPDAVGAGSFDVQVEVEEVG